ncbi:MAG: dephospho-CoA kinase [Kiritimatiellae bacterium]|nr:dephospho-CoA kinase [Kiritimatiellia bacterium]
MKVCLTGGIASGKSLLSHYLNELGVRTVDADDIVHELIPEEERERLRKIVFKNPKARKELEARIHPLVRQKILSAIEGAEGQASGGRSQESGVKGDCPPNLSLTPNPSHLNPNLSLPPIAVIPLLFEVQWEKDYDIIISILSSREKQVERMMSLRGYTHEEAEARLAAQMDPAIKAAKSDYVILNDSTDEDLKAEAKKLVDYLVSKSQA